MKVGIDKGMDRGEDEGGVVVVVEGRKENAKSMLCLDFQAQLGSAEYCKC